MVNPMLVEGQIRGGVAQGIGQVLYERAAYDDEGNFLAGTFMDYLLPTATEIPTIEIDHVESDPDGEIGFRGVGEGGMIVAPAALTNAVPVLKVIIGLPTVFCKVTWSVQTTR